MKAISGNGWSALVLLALSVSPASWAAGRVLDLDLDEGPMLTCLERLSQQAQVRIVDASERAATAHCDGLHERLSFEQGLARLLTPAGLTWHRRDDGTLEILAAPPRSHVDLSGLTVEGSPPDDPPHPDGRAPSLLAERAQGLTRIDRPWLDDAPLLGFDQLGRFAPNIYASGQGLAIRGTERDQEIFPALTVTLDGIDLGTRLLDDELVPMDGLDHIDFARGPRSFEAGGESAAGSIRLVTTAPTAEPQLRAMLGLGEAGERRAGLEWSGPIGSSGLGATIAIQHHDIPQFIHQALAPSADHPRDNDSARIKLSFLPDYLPGLSVDFSGLSIAGDSSDRWIVRAPDRSDGSQVPLNFSDRISYAQMPVVARTVARGAAGVVRYRFNAVAELELTGSATKIERNGVVFPARDIDTLDTESRQRLGADLHLQLSHDWKLTAGLERSDADVRRVIYSNVPRESVTNVSPSSRDYAEIYSDPSFAARSARLWLEYAPTETLSAGVGVRWQRDRADEHVTVRQCPGGTRPPCQMVIVDELGHARSQLPIPMATVEWRPWADQTFTLSHGRGYRSAGSLSATAKFLPEQDQSTELSWRAHWLDDRLRTSLTAFSSRMRHRFSYLVDGYSTSAHATGAEAEVEAELTPRWHVRAGFGVVHSYYSDGIGPVPGSPAPVTAAAPPSTAVLGLRYGQAQGIYGTLDVYHAKQAESLERNYSRLIRPAYSVVDLRVGFRHAHWDSALIVGNALDATYVDRAEQSFISYEPTVTERYRLGDPRRIEWRTTWTW